MFELLSQFIRFSAVGVVSAIGHYGLLIALVHRFEVDSIHASAAGALLGAIINYFLNYHFTFQSNKDHQESITKFAIVAAIGVLLNTLLMWIGVEVFHMHYLTAQVLTTLLLILWSFGSNRFWTFRPSKERP